MERIAQPPRYALLDTIRGITLCSMAAYHGCWDLVFLFGQPWNWYTGPAGFVWQQSICWTFIFLSGFCLALGRHSLRRGAVVFGAGALVTAVTLVFSYDSRVIFGVLTFLGSAMLLTGLLTPLLARLPAAAGLAGGVLLFVLTREVNSGWLGFGSWHLAALPAGLYRNLATTFLGFPMAGFYSTDYFSLLPWLFLFWAGYFTCRALRGRCGGRLPAWMGRGLAPFSWLGRHSLLVYLVHQPVLYGVFALLHLGGVL